MDDTACTNHFGLPLFLVVGISEHEHNQVIASVFLFNRTADEFKDFLDWVKPRLRHGDEAISPIAVIVDRHEGQYEAIREVFGDTRVIFCAKHLAQNISKTFGKQSFMLTGFWGLMKGTLREVQWRLRLDAAHVRWLVDSSKGRLIQWLFHNVEH
jgi:transposase-like protein